MSKITVTKEEALKIFELFNECNNKDGWKNNIINFIGDAKDIVCDMRTSGGAFGHVNACVRIVIDDIEFTQRHYGGQEIRFKDIVLQLNENDTRINPALMLFKSPGGTDLPQDYLKRFLRSYLIGKRTKEELLAIVNKRAEKDDALNTALIEENGKDKGFLGWVHVTPDVKKKYYLNKMTVEEVVRTAKLYKMTQGR